MSLEQLNKQSTVLKDITSELRRAGSFVLTTNEQVEKGAGRRIKRNQKFSSVRRALSNVAKRIITRPAKQAPRGNISKAQLARRQYLQYQGEDFQQPTEQQSQITPQSILKSAALLAAATAISKTDFGSLVSGMMSKLFTRDAADEIEKRALSISKDLDDVKEDVKKLEGTLGLANTSPKANTHTNVDIPSPINIPAADYKEPKLTDLPQVDRDQPQPSTRNVEVPENIEVPPSSIQEPQLEPLPAVQTTKQDLQPGLNDPAPKRQDSSYVKPAGKPSLTSDQRISSGSNKSSKYLRNVIGEVESKKDYRIYNYYDNEGRLRVGYMPEDFWTIKEIIKKQSSKGDGTVFAIGYYQFTPIPFKTLFEKAKESTKNKKDERGKSLEITSNSLFDEKTQDFFYSLTIFTSRKKISEYITKEGEPTERDLQMAALAASQEWAGLPTPFEVQYWQNPDAPDEQKKPTSNAQNIRVVGLSQGKPVPLDPGSQKSYYPPTLYKRDKNGNILKDEKNRPMLIYQGDQAGVPLKVLYKALEQERRVWLSLTPEEQKNYFQSLGIKLTGQQEKTPTDNKPSRTKTSELQSEERDTGDTPKLAQETPTPKDNIAPKVAELAPSSRQDGQNINDRSGKVAFEQQKQSEGAPPIINVVDNSTIVNQRRQAPPQTSSPSTIYSSLT